MRAHACGGGAVDGNVVNWTRILGIWSS